MIICRDMIDLLVTMDDIGYELEIGKVDKYLSFKDLNKRFALEELDMEILYAKLDSLHQDDAPEIITPFQVNEIIESLNREVLDDDVFDAKGLAIKRLSEEYNTPDYIIDTIKNLEDIGFEIADKENGEFTNWGYLYIPKR